MSEIPKFTWLGAEAPNDVDLLYGQGVRDFGVSLTSWRARVKNPPKALERFPDDVRLYLYDKYAWDTEASIEDLEEAAAKYERFVHNWYTKFSVVLEFDCPMFGLERIQERIDTFYDEDRFAPYFWPSWHPSYGHDYLRQLGEQYEDVVIPVSSLSDTSVLNLVQTLKTMYQTNFHCNGFSIDKSNRPEIFTSIFMSTWSSALKHGDFYVPHGGNWIKRLDKDEQKSNIRAHGDFIESLGCDPQLLLDGNTSEKEIYIVRLFRWLEVGHSAIADVLSENSGAESETDVPVTGTLVVDSGTRDTGQSPGDIVSNRYRLIEDQDHTIVSPTLPTMSVELKQTLGVVDGHATETSTPLVRRSEVPIRQCDTCSLASNCPAFLAGNPCKFKIPVELRTREQMQALTEALLEMQAARVFFAGFSEEVMGYHDPTVGKEMDRFARLARDLSKLGETKEIFRVEGSRTTQGGVLSALFGERAKKPQ